MKIGFWNTKYAFESPEKSQKAAEHIEKLDTDIIGILEIARSQERIYDLSFLRSLGYAGMVADYSNNPYFEASQRPRVPANYMPQMGLFSRIGSTKISAVTLGQRHGLTFTTADNPEVRGLLVHFDDRQEKNRLTALANIPPASQTNAPDVIFGDFNAMHRKSPHARILRATAQLGLPAALRLPKRLSSVLNRMQQMACGQTIEQIEEYGYTPATDNYRSTLFLGRLGVGQIDHIYTSQATKATNFTRHYSPISDHAALQCRIQKI